MLVNPRKNQFELECGETIEIVALNQCYTYEGLLEGIPTMWMNRRAIVDAIDSARKLWGTEPHLIQPVEIPISPGRDYPFGEPARIPGVICLARFRSGFEIQGDECGCRELSIVWFQADFGLPEDEQILKTLKSLDWPRLATFREY